MSSSTSIGSFRDNGDLLQDLPAEISSLREVEDVADMKFSLQSDVAHLNHGAFGAVSDPMIELEKSIRSLAHSNPSHFYDHLCLPLVRESINEASLFFNGNVILQPNCTIALKSIVEIFDKSTVVARLTPIYGASTKLLTHMFPQHVTIEPGFFNEDSDDIIQCLDKAYEEKPFTVLFADHVASQTGRILPLRAVVEWCSAKTVISVIDGTQACWFDNNVWPDYYVMSTHKWLGNIKTCAVVRIEGNATVPEPVGISFGYPHPFDRHLWTGMLDYVPYIMLAKAIRVYRQHGKEMLRLSLNNMAEGVKILRLKPKLSLSVISPDDGQLEKLLERSGHPRTMCMIRVNRFEDNLQNALEKYGVCVSVKSLDGATYLRISSWVYNTRDDFVLLADFLQYRIRLNYGLGSTPELQSARKRLQILQTVEHQMNIEEKLYAQMTVDAFFHRAEILRHPLIFYYGHTAVFYMNKLVLGMYLSYEDKIDPELESLCAVGVDEMSWDDLTLGAWDETPQEQMLSQFTRVKEYRSKMMNLMRSMILDPSRELTLPITEDTIWWVFCMGIEHSRIHVETSSVIMAQLPLSMFNSTGDMWQISNERTSVREEVPVNRLVKVNGGTVRAGRALKNAFIFGWDNEFGKGKEVHLKDFEVSQMLVSNAEYEEFIDAGGFDKREYWSEDGWNWAHDKNYPRFWLHQGKGVTPKLRTLTQEIDMPYNWPVMCNNYEAEAFCNWKSTVLGKKVRMISHPEFLLLTDRSQSNDYNLNFQESGSACPVNKFCEALGVDGSPIYDVRGNLWQHSRSLLTVLPEFQVHPLYDDFSLPTIDGEHSFILGGSWTSLGNCAESNARYGFRRHFYQFAGIRYVCSENEDLDKPKKLVQGEAALALAENFLDFENPVFLNEQPVRNAMEEFGAFASQYVNDGDSVVVLNGSVGRITVEIAQNSSPSSILHTDPTANSLDAFLYAKENGSIRFDRTIEGNICKTEEVEFPPEWKEALTKMDISVKQVDTFRVTSDLCGEPRDVAIVDLVQVNKSICPRRGQIPPNLHVFVKPGGRLIIQCPFAEGQDISPPSIAGFNPLDSHMNYSHIFQETRRVHRYSNTHCFLYERLEEHNECISVSEEKETNPGLQYEQDEEIAKYMNFHFNDSEICGIPNFPVACSKVCLEACRKHNIPLSEVLDAGCGPGRLGISLSEAFQHVTAFDYSSKFLAAAKEHQTKNMTLLEADAHVVHTCPDVQGKKFNLIVGANLVDRMSNPRQWIQNSKKLLAEDGLLVIFSPFTWMKEFTKEENWLGGFRQDSEVVWSLQGLIRHAGPELCVCEPPSHIPLAIPNADGTVSYVYSQCVIFGRKGKKCDVSLTDINYNSLRC
jgi:5-histidylcysteine sulfoxide synthase